MRSRALHECRCEHCQSNDEKVQRHHHQLNLLMSRLDERQRRWFGPVPATDPARTLEDCAHGSLSPEHLRFAALGALDRGLVARAEIGAVEAALEAFGGLNP